MLNDAASTNTGTVGRLRRGFKQAKCIFTFENRNAKTQIQKLLFYRLTKYVFEPSTCVFGINQVRILGD